MTLVMTKELAALLEKSEIDMFYSRLTAMKEMDRNPMGVEIRQFGNATAFTVKHIPGPSFNTVKGLTTEDAGHIDSIIDFYKQRDIPARFELIPAHTSPDLLESLSNKGFYHYDFHATLYAGAENVHSGGPNLDIAIREFHRNEFDIFAEIYTRGFQMPAFLKIGVAQNNEILYDNEHWNFYLATVKNEPAGIGVLFVNDGIATLAAAATLPDFRKKGVQSALIKKRIELGILQGCQLIAGQAAFGSISQNNMERAGLKIAYTKARWRQM